jgi:Cys-rich protein (TIGR01571 family)
MAQTVEWQTGICDCGRDSTVCCLTCLCPYVVFGEIAEGLTESDPARHRQVDTCFLQGLIYGLLCHVSCCLVSVYTYKWRTKLRNKYKLKATPFSSDLLTHCLCHCCALCQERRELKDRQGVAAYSDASTFQNPTAAPDFKSTQMVRWFGNSHKPIGRSVHSKIDQLLVMSILGVFSLYIVDLGSESRLVRFASLEAFIWCFIHN